MPAWVRWNLGPTTTPKMRQHETTRKVLYSHTIFLNIISFADYRILRHSRCPRMRYTPVLDHLNEEHDNQRLDLWLCRGTDFWDVCIFVFNYSKNKPHVLEASMVHVGSLQPRSLVGSHPVCLEILRSTRIVGPVLLLISCYITCTP